MSVDVADAKSEQGLFRYESEYFVMMGQGGLRQIFEQGKNGRAWLEDAHGEFTDDEGVGEDAILL